MSVRPFPASSVLLRPPPSFTASSSVLWSHLSFSGLVGLLLPPPASPASSSFIPLSPAFSVFSTCSLRTHSSFSGLLRLYVRIQNPPISRHVTHGVPCVRPLPSFCGLLQSSPMLFILLRHHLFFDLLHLSSTFDLLRPLPAFSGIHRPSSSSSGLLRHSVPASSVLLIT